MGGKVAQKIKNHESKFSWLAICCDVVVCNVCICITDRMIPFHSLEGNHQVLDIISSSEILQFD